MGFLKVAGEPGENGQFPVSCFCGYGFVATVNPDMTVEYLEPLPGGFLKPE